MAVIEKDRVQIFYTVVLERLNFAKWNVHRIRRVKVSGGCRGVVISQALLFQCQQHVLAALSTLKTTVVRLN